MLFFVACMEEDHAPRHFLLLLSGFVVFTVSTWYGAYWLSARFFRLFFGSFHGSCFPTFLSFLGTDHIFPFFFGIWKRGACCAGHVFLFLSPLGAVLFFGRSFWFCFLSSFLFSRSLHDSLAGGFSGPSPFFLFAGSMLFSFVWCHGRVVGLCFLALFPFLGFFALDVTMCTSFLTRMLAAGWHFSQHVVFQRDVSACGFPPFFSLVFRSFLIWTLNTGSAGCFSLWFAPFFLRSFGSSTFFNSSPDTTTLLAAGIFCTSFFMDPGSTCEYLLFRFSINILIDMGLLGQFLMVF